MALTDEEKERAKRLLDSYFKAVDEGAPCTAIFTTDGDRRIMFGSDCALPNRYLEPWQDDQKTGVEMSLDFSGAEKKIDQDKVIRVGETVLKPFPVPRPNKE